MRFLKLLPGIFGACLMGMMQVGPSDAELNFCKWVRWAWPNAEEKCLAIPHLAPSIWAIATVLILISLVMVFMRRRLLAAKNIVEPDLNAADGFLTLIAKSRWAASHRKQWQSLRTVRYETSRPKADVIRDRLHQELDDLIHDHLRQGNLTAWGRPSLRHGTGPEEKIEPEKWREIEIHFDARSLGGNPPNICAFQRNVGPRGGGLAYVQIRFSKAQLFRAYPLGWRRFKQAPTPAITTNQSGRQNRESIPKNPPSESNSNNQNSIEWNFEPNPAHVVFIGMSAGPNQEIRIHNFQARGWNRTGDPITIINGYVRSDRTNEIFPIKINDGAGNMIEPSRVEIIPVGAHMDVVAAFSPDGSVISLSKFLSEIIPFTFFFEYDGAKFRRTFTITDIEPRIKEYEQNIRNSLLTPPRIKTKDEDALRQERRSLIDRGRVFVSATVRETREYFHFVKKLESDEIYFKLRPYLTKEFISAMHAKPITLVMGTTMPGISIAFLKELERLEKEWGLDVG